MIKKEIIDLAKHYSADINGRTIYNCLSEQIALAIETDEAGEITYICYGIDGSEWKFKQFNQVCIFHSVFTLIGFNYELLDEYYNRIKEEQ